MIFKKIYKTKYCIGQMQRLHFVYIFFMNMNYIYCIIQNVKCVQKTSSKIQQNTDEVSKTCYFGLC